MGVLLARGHGPGLRRLADEADLEWANAITPAWFAGFYQDAADTTAADVNAALLWNALTFTKPWGACGGETGDWSDPPPP